MPRSYFQGIQKKTCKKPDLSYLFDSSAQYGTWSDMQTHKKQKKKKQKRKQLEEFLQDYSDFQDGGQ